MIVVVQRRRIRNFHLGRHSRHGIVEGRRHVALIIVVAISCRYFADSAVAQRRSEAALVVVAVFLVIRNSYFHPAVHWR